jgi:hypothetical protein
VTATARAARPSLSRHRHPALRRKGIVPPSSELRKSYAWAAAGVEPDLQE